IIDGHHEQCWRCSSGLRKTAAPTFTQYAANGTAIAHEGNVATWFDPTGCPVEYIQNNPQDLACDGNPIACESGTKVLAEVDYQSPTDDGLQFARNYNSPDVNTDNPQAFLGG